MNELQLSFFGDHVKHPPATTRTTPKPEPGKTGNQLRDEGMAATYEAETLAWKKRAEEIVRKQLRGYVTGEEIREEVELKIGQAHSPHFWGALIRKLITADVLKKTKTRRRMKDPKARGRDTPVYRVMPR